MDNSLYIDDNDHINKDEPNKEAVQAAVKGAREASDFLTKVKKHQLEGWSEKNIAGSFGISVSQLRASVVIANNERRKEELDQGVQASHQTQPNHFLDTARELVLKHYNRFYVDKGSDLLISEISVVWCSKTLQNWKACLVTSFVDNLYFEVTHNGDKNETYLDCYRKISNEVITDAVSHSRYGKPTEGSDQ